MCRAFNFCNPLQVEAIMKYLFDHSKKVKSMLRLFSLRPTSLTLLMAFDIINNTGLDFPPFMILNWYSIFACLMMAVKGWGEYAGPTRCDMSFLHILKHPDNHPSIKMKLWTVSVLMVSLLAAFQSKQGFYLSHCSQNTMTNVAELEFVGLSWYLKGDWWGICTNWYLSSIRNPNPNPIPKTNPNHIPT